jgi:Cu(I)/Ag(I) efflux system membrane fusion protein
VVTNGAFKIDSALQIRAEQSMMSAGNEASREAEEVPAAVHEHLRSVLRGYFSVHEALASDALEAARAAASSLPGEVGRVPRDLLDPAAAQTWDSVAAELVTASRALASASSLEAARATFETLSRSAIRLVRSFGAGGDGPVHVIHCPMAFDNRGADWLQPDPEVRNPYFGSAMYRCGDVVEVLAAGEDPSGTGSSAPTDPGGAR